MRPNLPPLTSLRFLAASGVVVFHYNLTRHLFPDVIGSFGYELVTFFFVLPGFILAYAHGIPGVGLNVSSKDFFIGRFARIWPVYGFASAMVILLFAVVGILKASFVLPAILVVSMIQAWIPQFALALNPSAWSLSNELLFYILFPALWGLTRRLNVTSFIACTAILVLFVALLRARIPASEPGWNNFWQYFPILNLPQFIFGVALGYWFVVHRSVGQKMYAGLLLTGVVTIGMVIAFKTSVEWLSSTAVLTAAYAAIICGAAGIGGLVQKLLCARFLVILGEASYAIYILHFPVWLWWNHYTKIAYELNLTSIVDFLLYSSVLVLLSLASFVCLEKPARHALRRHLRGFH